MAYRLFKKKDSDTCTFGHKYNVIYISGYFHWFSIHIRFTYPTYVLYKYCVSEIRSIYLRLINARLQRSLALPLFQTSTVRDMYLRNNQICICIRSIIMTQFSFIPSQWRFQTKCIIKKPHHIITSINSMTDCPFICKSLHIRFFDSKYQ